VKAIIAGAGLGGLTAALQLHRAGFEVEVYEQVTELRPLGVGINLLPHGAGELIRLGLGDGLARIGIETHEVQYRTRFGQLIFADPSGLAAGAPYPHYSVHRGELQFLLLDALRERAGDVVRTGMEFARIVSNDTGGVVAEFHDRANGMAPVTVTGDFLIGADGIHSAVRHGFYPDQPPIHSEGVLMRRGATEMEPFLDGRTMVIAGNHDSKLVIYPISGAAARQGRALVNWVAELRYAAPGAEEVADWGRSSANRDFARAFDGFRLDFIDLDAMFGGTDRIYEYPMVDREPVDRWTFGRVTLLGDAAHPMYPIGANGASQAIIDAGALTSSLADTDDITAGLQEYEKRRLAKTTAIVLGNRGSGPEKVLDLADARVTGPEDSIEQLIGEEELRRTISDYKKLAGFDMTSFTTA
jgi:2-polyprenyl-6-methoxyphenol hydroxylase-like FAD-dependent oxidoreductase